MRLRLTRSLAIFLSVFVLFAQHGAYLHALSHAVQDAAGSALSSDARAGRQDPQTPSGHESCEDCLSFAAAGAALVGSVIYSLLSMVIDSALEALFAKK